MPEFLRVANYPEDYDGTGVGFFSTDAGTFDPDYAAGSLRINTTDFSGRDAQPGSTPTIVLDAGVEDFWLRYQLYLAAMFNSSFVRGLILKDRNNREVADIRKTTSSALQLRVHGSTTVTSAGSVTALPSSTLFEMCIHCVVDATDITAEVYIDGIEVLSATVAKGPAEPVKQFSVGHPWTDGANNSRWSAVSETLVTDGIDPRGLRVSARRPEAAGAVNTMAAGTFSDIVSGGGTGLVAADAAGQRLTWVPEAYNGPVSPQNIRAVMASAKASRQSGEPSRLAQSLRVGGVNYDSALEPVGFVTYQSAVWDLNPATGQPWTAAELDQLQVGLIAGDSA